VRALTIRSSHTALGVVIDAQRNRERLWAIGAPGRFVTTPNAVVIASSFSRQSRRRPPSFSPDRY